ncbi:hypothetical protein CC1G_06799 [Coprinopsis cinerea okayama7|uniref:Uncharacterized protein n=1 Tax=Coprinopsis cinerea (strain Okayama-7 / 130 / ATCC MYA-4618 / FGSC 9003) TaxID=240176 RepID=A8N1S1_COPC7|nr:hypothetical protein CC1G_06799 [Coprinopsis cinerea okayama7\|eukprot:XP_001828813.2 hypothetical protein CC1G_06799 [Coprinopsis cinerea okayama7\
MKATGMARPLSTSGTPAARRRPPSKIVSVPHVNGDTTEALSASLKQETDKKEKLLLQVQDKEQTISTLTAENANLSSALNAAESRLTDLYAEQARWEMELAQRIEIAEKLREQVRELEKEKRDLQRRYNEQTASFDAERQSFYDNEQHLKSRIQSLTQARKRAETLASRAEPPALPVVQVSEKPDPPPEPVKPTTPDLNDPDNEPAEMTALKLELSTLSTSYASMQSTLVMLQSQLVDLKRVNQGLQEENESYMILLREKTLSGQFDLMRQVGGGNRSSDEDDLDDDDERGTSADGRSLRSTGKSLLDRVDEEPEGMSIPIADELDFAKDIPVSPRPSRHNSRQGRRRTTSTSTPRGESLADLPVAGPGLDLAAELGRAQNKDILEGNAIDDNDDRNPLGVTSPKKLRKSDDKAAAEVEALRSEIKSLKDANKALSLYASKIIDRIIAQEGFEHVLAADYEKEPPTPSTPGPIAPPRASPAKPRPQSVLITRTTSTPVPSTPTKLISPPMAKPAAKANRRSLSFDWKSFSFTSEPKKAEPANLRPLTLKPGSSPIVTGARKLDTEEDEEDRKERERLNATMKLMGIQPQSSIHSNASTRSVEKPVDSPSASASTNRRFSFWGNPKPSADNSDAASNNSRPSTESSRLGLGLGLTSTDLTHDALAQAEAQNSLAALDARERNLTEEIAKGANGGYTEISRRSAGRRSRRSAGGSGSGSTVFSAGMSVGDDD